MQSSHKRTGRLLIFNLSALFFISLTCRAAEPPGLTEIEEQRDSIIEARVTADKYARQARSQTGHKRLERIDFMYGNVVFSSPDLIKTIQNLPGVSSGTELLSGLYVHGGEGSDNLFLLDGVPMYQVNHLGGLFSSFNTDIVDHLDFYKSGFPARYGGRLSSVVDVSTRNGDFDEYHGTFMIGLIDGRLQFEGPIVKGKTSFSIAARRSWLDAVIIPAIYLANKMSEDGESAGGSYSFYDLNASISHRFSDDNILSLKFYHGRDRLKLSLDAIDDGTEQGNGNSGTGQELQEMNTGIAWGNTLASLNWSRRIKDNMDMRAVLYYTSSNADVGSHLYIESTEEEMPSTVSMDESNLSNVSDIALSSDFTWQPHKAHDVRFGTSMQYHTYNPSRRSDIQGGTMQQNGSSSQFYKGLEFSLYAEDEITFAERLSLNLGLRYAMFGVSGKTWNKLEPRAALNLKCTGWMDFKLSYSEMNQFSHLISTTYLDMPTNCWLPSTAKIAPMLARQVAGGIYSRLPHNFRLNIEGWYKTMDNLLEYSGSNAFFPPLDTWETSFNKGKGRSYGLEAELGWRSERLLLSAYYTLSWSQRKFEAVWTDWYSHRYDNRHKLTLMGRWKITEAVDLYATWNYNSGGWMTVPTHIYNPGEVFDRIYTKPNNVNLPDYHRLDIGANFRRTTKRGNEVIWNIGIYNAYCRKNVAFVVIDERPDKSLYGTGYAIFPLIPSFSYTLRF